ncbi:MAG: DMT family transporter [Spirochaetes bacterium]|nr:DMT family transporter [Spirochaetota bacterium]
MNSKALKADILLLITACIWGFGFVAQRAGMEHIGPFAFNGIRFLLGTLPLLPFIVVRRKKGISAAPLRGLLMPSFAAGACLFVAVLLQQLGIMFTTAGHAGFITGLYVVLTPIFGIFLGRKTGKATWLGCLFTITGLYFISTAGSGQGGSHGFGQMNPGDIIIIISAFFWAAHVLLIDRLVQGAPSQHGGKESVGQRLDPVELSAGQFVVCGFFALAGAFFLEPYLAAIIAGIDYSWLEIGLFTWLPFPALLESLTQGGGGLPAGALVTILYGGLVSVGIAYTLQVIAQREAPPAHATIILCLEGSFAALGGVLLLSERIGAQSLLGFALMLLGMIVTQWEVIIKAGGEKVKKH